MVRVKYITAPQSIKGLDNIFGGWLVRIPFASAPDGEFTALVDTGTAAAAPAFIAALKAEGIKRIDLILISHIHVDHAGALAEVLEAFPGARALCHSGGIRHLVSPERLWESTQKVMSFLAEMYGRPSPVPEEKLTGFSPDSLSSLPKDTLPFEFPEIKAMAVPGHAPHSMFYSLGGYYFIGEAACCTFEWKNRTFFRPATPPRFELPIFLKSIDKLLALPDRPAFAGHNAQSCSSHRLLECSRAQLCRWLELLTPMTEPMPGESESMHLERLLDMLLEKDEELGPIGVWAQNAELDRFFHKNAIIGFVDYIRRSGAASA
ncbi:MAG: MBL fold metallo-hydrolase [Desulfovibrionaceae bacterium]|nr:MBL fold metallo-hydrolase [Desulfovibrionaceae bacterium]